MRLISLKQGRDFNYDTTTVFSFSIHEKENSPDEVYVLRAVESVSGKDIQIAKSFNKAEIEGKMREIAVAYEKGEKVYFID